MPDGTYAHSCVAARVDVVCGAVNATAVAPRKARASFMIAVGACARSRRSVVGSRRSSVVASRRPSRASSSSRWRRTAPANSGQRGATARKLQYARGVRMGIRTYRCANSRASHGNCGCFGAVSPSRAARAFLVAVKLVQTGDEPLGTTNKIVRDSGTHGSWSMRCNTARGPAPRWWATNLRCRVLRASRAERQGQA